jgi:hypothetical protein
MHYETEEKQAEVAEKGVPSSSFGMLALKPSHECEAIRKPNSQKELWHDGVGKAAISVMVPEKGRHAGIAADEIDQKHAGYGEASKLVNGFQPLGLRFSFRSLGGHGFGHLKIYPNYFICR